MHRLATLEEITTTVALPDGAYYWSNRHTDARMITLFDPINGPRGGIWKPARLDPLPYCGMWDNVWSYGSGLIGRDGIDGHTAHEMRTHWERIGAYEPMSHHIAECTDCHRALQALLWDRSETLTTR